jgi:predicted ATPase/DNA-binding CsgD family transcriptional regulator
MDKGLIGREAECEALQHLLARSDVRLVTLTGPGGIGKTRLGMAVADRLLDSFEDGISIVMLAAVREPAEVLVSIAKALGLQGQDARPLFERVRERLQGRQPLMVLDNFEQVVAAAPLIGQLVAQAPRLKVLVTSRCRLHVGAEHEFALGPLRVPASDRSGDGAERDAPAVALFEQRAHAVDPGFRVDASNAHTVAAICRCLDGWPLAIELAAARVKLLPVEQLLGRLEQRLPWLVGGPVDSPERNRTLRRTLDWSFDLLGPREQVVFACMGVFAGGAPLEAAERVCEADVEAIERLVDHSLVVQDGGRLGLLEIVREYAIERLQAQGNADAVRLRHAEYFVGLANEGAYELTGPLQKQWFDRLGAELDNSRAAMTWCLHHGHARLALSLATALSTVWDLRGLAGEGRRWIEQALLQAEDADTAQTSLAWATMGWLAACSADGAGACAAARRAREQCPPHIDPQDRLLVFRRIGGAAMLAGDYELAHAALERSLQLARADQDERGTGVALFQIGMLHRLQGHHVLAQQVTEEGASRCRQAGNVRSYGYALAVLAAQAFDEGRWDQAEPMLLSALSIGRELADRRLVGLLLCQLGVVRWFARGSDSARPVLVEGMAEAVAVGAVGDALMALECVALACAEGGQGLLAARMLGAAEALHQSLAVPWHPVHQARVDRCRTLLRKGLDRRSLEQALADGANLSLGQVLALVGRVNAASLAGTGTDASPPLTTRERAVLDLVCRGLSDKQIAEQLRIHPSTASKHVHNILTKTGQPSRIALAVWAVREGLTERPRES